MRNAKIIASSSSVPSRIISNQYFNDLLGEDVDSWLKQHVQIHNRRWCSPDESVADLVEKACIEAIEVAKLEPSEIDLLIVATDTPEFISPSTASVIQHRLKLTNAGTFDLNTACAGFVTALDVGTKYIRADEKYKHVLVVGAYTMSKHLNPLDKKTVTLFADGAGAVILGLCQSDEGFQQSKLISKGEYNSWMGIYHGGSKYPVDHDAISNHDHQLKFVQKIPNNVNPDTWTHMILDICAAQCIVPDDIDHYFITQININSIYETMDRIGVNRSKAATIMHEYGYTGSACIPMAFDQWQKAGKIKKGDLVLFIGSGGGLAFGASLFIM